MGQIRGTANRKPLSPNNGVRWQSDLGWLPDPHCVGFLVWKGLASCLVVSFRRTERSEPGFALLSGIRIRHVRRSNTKTTI